MLKVPSRHKSAAASEASVAKSSCTSLNNRPPGVFCPLAIASSGAAELFQACGRGPCPVFASLV